ncbi:MAG: metabolite traffic protein EboE [Verrucomicrobiales bacterium]|nr:metabolite traffic protein EboE [Verrucomicrobiales bacterium]
MRLKHNIDLGYCTNIHRGETWEETFDGLQRYTDEVRKRVSPDQPYGIGLRLGHDACRELASDAAAKDGFRRWLDDRNAYVFTINGFPYGKFHGSRVKEQVYAPDWTTTERLDYTKQLFDLMVELSPGGQSISVSTVPGSFKGFIKPETRQEQLEAMYRNLTACADHIESLREKTGRDIHLGLEPEPLCLFETSEETIEFFDGYLSGREGDERSRILSNIGVNYDTCHLAIEYEDPGSSVEGLLDAGIRISKIHLSSALKLTPNPESVKRLEAFQDEVYLHQVVVRSGDSVTHRFVDLPDAFSWFEENSANAGDEWRVHFHVPLHARAVEYFDDTRDQISGVFQLLKDASSTDGELFCQHFEMETYTWEVLPEEIRSRDVVDQLEAEYGWTLSEFRRYGLA